VVTFLSCGCSRDATGRKRTNLYGVFDRVSQDLTAFVLSVVGDVPIDSETFVVTSSILRICRFEDAPRGRVCVCIQRDECACVVESVSGKKSCAAFFFSVDGGARRGACGCGAAHIHQFPRRSAGTHAGTTSRAVATTKASSSSLYSVLGIIRDINRRCVAGTSRTY
jgi:hypothetical protein